MIRLMKWHRAIAWVAGITFLLWAGSGLLHPMMTWTNPRPVSFKPPVVAEGSLPNVKKLLKAEGISAVGGVRLVEGNVTQVSVPGQAERLYFYKGRLVPHRDEDRAVMLARHYTGAKENVRSAVLTTEFSNKYPAINRFLPVWKVVFERADSLTAYVETDTDRLASITNRRKVILQTGFQAVHTLNFLDGVEGVRVGIIACAIATVLGMAGLGMALLLGLRRPNGTRGERRLHRFVAVIAWIPFFCFPASGLFHLIMQSSLAQPEMRQVERSVSTSALPAAPRRGLAPRLVILPDGVAVWHTDRSDDRALALRIAGVDTAEATEVTKFSSEYGFAYKRLPVWRVVKGEDVLFIEPRTATIAARAGRVKTIESWSFSTFHKWNFLDPVMPMAARDLIMVAFVLLGMGMAVSGLMMRRRSGRAGSPGTGRPPV